MENTQVLPSQHSAGPFTPPAPRPRNKIGLIAMILGIVAMVTSLIPFVNFSVGLVGLAGLILGIIGLNRKGLPRGQALTGVILSSVAMIVAIVMIIAYSLMFASALGESLEESFQSEWETVEDDPFGGKSLFDDEPGFDEEAELEEVELDEAEFDEAELDEMEWEPVAEGELGPDLGIPDDAGAADSPLPLGTPMRVMGLSEWEWELVLGPPMLNANSFVAQAHPNNKPAPDGKQYIAVDATVTYIGSKETNKHMPSFGLDFAFSDGTDNPREYIQKLKNVHQGFKGLSLEQDASTTITFFKLVPTAEVETGMWKVSQSFWGRDVYFTVQ